MLPVVHEYIEQYSPSYNRYNNNKEDEEERKALCKNIIRKKEKNELLKVGIFLA